MKLKGRMEGRQYFHPAIDTIFFNQLINVPIRDPFRVSAVDCPESGQGIGS